MTLCIEAPPAKAVPVRHPAVTAKVIVPTEANGYAELRPFIPLWADLLAQYEPSAAQNGLRHVTWLTAIACAPTSRLYGFYDGEHLVGSVLAQPQDVAYARRLWVHFCSVRPGYRTAAAGRAVEADLRAWGKAMGAQYLEAEVEADTGRKPDVWSRRFCGHLHGYIMRSPL